jgi:hypothetical protein
MTKNLRLEMELVYSTITTAEKFFNSLKSLNCYLSS